MGSGESVMIVDDETALVSLSEEILAELGYEPVGFSSSPQALAAFRADPDRFSAILTDEAMPEMTGTELVREIRRIRPQLPILLMSGHGGAALEAQAEQLGVAAVLHKPLQRRDLAEAISRTFKTVAPAER
jgi:DNA-binding NtrC family response regulator